MKILNGLLDILLGWIAIGLSALGVAAGVPAAALILTARFLNRQTRHASKNP